MSRTRNELKGWSGSLNKPGTDGPGLRCMTDHDETERMNVPVILLDAVTNHEMPKMRRENAEYL